LNALNALLEKMHALRNKILNLKQQYGNNEELEEYKEPLKELELLIQKAYLKIKDINTQKNH